MPVTTLYWSFVFLLIANDTVDFENCTSEIESSA